MKLIIEITENSYKYLKSKRNKSAAENVIANGLIYREQPTGEWGKWIISEIRCPNCLAYFDPEWHSAEELKKCPSCLAKMKEGGQE